MRKILLLFLLPVTQAFSQTTFQLELVAEGNFGTPNGDVFVRSTTVNPATTSTGTYQTANGTTGFDVLQDFVIAGNKAVFAEKPSGTGRIAIVDYPSMNLIHTFAQAPQTLGTASSTKVYACYAQGGVVSLVDLVNNTLTPVIEPNNEITTYGNHMQAAGGYMYVNQAGDLVKIDTLTNTVVSKFNPGVGSIAGITYDNQGKLWVIGGTNIVSVDVLNNDALGTPVNVGVSGKLLRYYNNSLYFWTLADKKLFKYDLVNPPVTPLTAVYTSALPGNSWSFGYGRAFDIDQNTGDFAIASANNYSAPGYYEVVDGTTFTLIESANIPGCAIPNKCFVKTYHQPVGSNPIPDITSLPAISEQCSVNLTAPTADNGAVTATTTDPVSYDEQGTYTVTWTYTNSTGTSTQTQQVTIEDNIDPIAVVNPVTLVCGETVSTPTATDNCAGTITGTTNNPVSFTSVGTYTINWSFDDGNGNTISVIQQVTVEDVTDPVAVVNPVTIDCGIAVSAPVAMDNCAGTIAGTTLDPVTFSTAGNFVINWTFDDNNGNEISVAQQVTVNCTVGINDNNLSLGVYPNPAKTFLTIESENAINTYVITDLNGREILRMESAGQKSTIDVSGFAEGMYLLSNGKSASRFSVLH